MRQTLSVKQPTGTAQQKGPAPSPWHSGTPVQMSPGLSRLAGPAVRLFAPDRPVQQQLVPVQRAGDKLAFQYAPQPQEADLKAIEALRAVVEEERRTKRGIKNKIEDIFAEDLMEIDAEDEKSKEQQQGVSKPKKSKSTLQNDAQDKYLDLREAHTGWRLERLLPAVEQVAKEHNLTVTQGGSSIQVTSATTQAVLLEIFQGEARFEAPQQLPGGGSLIGKKGSKKQYVQDLYGAKVPRYVVRYITMRERNRLAQKFGQALPETYTTEAPTQVIVPREKSQEPTAFEKEHFEGLPDRKLDSLEQEFLLNRTGTQRKLPTTSTKQTARSNYMEPFVRHADKVYEFQVGDQKRYGKGGGLVLLDLSAMKPEQIASQFSEEVMAQMKGFGRKPEESHPKPTSPEEEIEKAKRSAMRNREIHLGPRVPDSAILAWAKGPEGPWLQPGEVTLNDETTKKPGGQVYTSNLEPYKQDQKALRLSPEMAQGLAEGVAWTREDVARAHEERERAQFAHMVQNAGEAAFLRGLQASAELFEVVKDNPPEIYFQGAPVLGPILQQLGKKGGSIAKPLTSEEKESTWGAFPFILLRPDVWDLPGGGNTYFNMDWAAASKAFNALIKRGVILAYAGVGVRINGNIAGSIAEALKTMQ